MPGNSIDCLFAKALEIQLLHLEDVFVTGILRDACNIEVQNMDGIQIWNDFCDQDAILVHQISPEKQFLYQRNVLETQNVCS